MPSTASTWGVLLATYPATVASVGQNTLTGEGVCFGVKAFCFDPGTLRAAKAFGLLFVGGRPTRKRRTPCAVSPQDAVRAEWHRSLDPPPLREPERRSDGGVLHPALVYGPLVIERGQTGKGKETVSRR